MQWFYVIDLKKATRDAWEVIRSKEESQRRTDRLLDKAWSDYREVLADNARLKEMISNAREDLTIN